MATPKVQLIKDYGCGMGSFATIPEAEPAQAPKKPSTADTQQSVPEESN